MSTPPSLNQLVISKQPINPQSAPLKPPPPLRTTTNPEKPPPILWRPRQTKPVVWFVAIVCLIFSLLLILFGVVTLIVFLAIKPRTPVFDTPGASLSSIYFASSEYFNGDFTLLANFSNPNRRITVAFEYVEIELYFSDRLIGVQAIQPFTQKPGQTRLESVRVISSLVYMPRTYAGELQKQVNSYKVIYTIHGNFRVRATLGLTHFSYWLHGRCKLEMTGPPTGTLISRRCRTKR